MCKIRKYAQKNGPLPKFPGKGRVSRKFWALYANPLIPKFVWGEPASKEFRAAEAGFLRAKAEPFIDPLAL